MADRSATITMSEQGPTRAVNEDRVAQITVRDGSPIGACLFLTAEQLEQLGIDTALVDTVRYRVDPSVGGVTLQPEPIQQATNNQS